jgi:hypothetical protein
MKKNQCFVNEAEICLYLDKEIDKIRGAALDEHIDACYNCAQKLAAWKELRDLVRGALITSKAPKHLTETIRQGLTAVTSIGDTIILPEDIGHIPWPRAQFQHPAYPIRPDSSQWN